MSRHSGKLKIPITVTGDPEVVLQRSAIIIEEIEKEFTATLSQLQLQLQTITESRNGGTTAPTISVATLDNFRKIYNQFKTIRENYFVAQRDRHQNVQMLLEKWKMNAIIELTNLDFVSADLNEDSLKKTPWDIYLDADNEGNTKAEEVIIN